MCDTCGCNQEDKTTISKYPKKKETPELEGKHEHFHNHQHKTKIEVEQDILSANNQLALKNREYFTKNNVFSLNIVSSPGSGKTTLLERTLQDLKNEIEFSVIEGDLQTSNDAERINALEIPVVQINTGQACHLDSDMINKAIKEIDPKQNSILFIENVGNLVCPSLFDLGEKKRVVIFSVTEGDDKPVKYPGIFSSSDVCIINKVDLLPYVSFDMDKAKRFALGINHHLEIFEISATTGEGVEGWYNWLKKQIKKK